MSKIIDEDDISECRSCCGGGCFGLIVFVFVLLALFFNQ